VISDELLKLADLHGEEVNRGRYEVLREAIAKGLLALRIEHEVARNPHRYARDLHEMMQGNEVAAASVKSKLETDLLDGVKARLKASGDA
jgi:hypothetical protein